MLTWYLVTIAFKILDLVFEIKIWLFNRLFTAVFKIKFTTRPFFKAFVPKQLKVSSFDEYYYVKIMLFVA